MEKRSKKVSDSIDMHIHITKNLDIKKGIKWAEELGLKVISFIQHNGTKTYDEIKSQNLDKEFSGFIIPGIEMRIEYKGHQLDMLGYGFDPNRIRDSKWLNINAREAEEYYFEELKKCALKIGIKIDPNIKLQPAQYANNTITAHVHSFPENKPILDSLEIFEGDHYIEFWRKHACNPNSPFYIDISKYFPTLEEVSNLIREAGGMVFFAHPFAYGKTKEEEMKIAEEIAQSGYVDGLETLHKDYGAPENKKIITLCKKYNLHMTGGSDFHEKETVIGTAGDNRYKIPFALIESWAYKYIDYQKEQVSPGKSL
jgi:predicted metal-dependent phosphoesterase TrpH